ncbi:MAG TPA: aminoacyl-tRNA hydrolase [Rhodospirillaceae bacterium]|nr:aminoacyl-tRNA hydrolase [Rhodospirillaceae bacterium]
MWLFVGLGNPGSEYERNRHNIGFMAVDEIASVYNFSGFKKKYQGEYCEGVIAGEKIILLKPMTYMNESGRSVQALSSFYKIPTSHIVAFHDELDVAPSKVKTKIGGGAGGHNGIRSMDAHLPDIHYKRVRLGIGHPGDKDRVHGYVLGNFSREDEKWLSDLLKVVAKEAPLLIKGDDARFISNIALASQPPKAKKEPKKDLEKDLKNGI